MVSKLTQSQKVAHSLIAHSNSIKLSGITLLYSPAPKAHIASKFTTCIITSISKKIIPKATARNKLRRQLKYLLLQNLSKQEINMYNFMWICKSNTITKETKNELIEKIKKSLHETINN